MKPSCGSGSPRSCPCWSRRACASGGAETRQRHVGCDVVENGFHWHADFYLLPWCVDEATNENHRGIGFVDHDACHSVWSLVGECRMRLMDHHIRLDTSRLAQGVPVEVPRVAVWAEPLRRPAEPMAGGTALRPELVLVGAIPVRL